MKNVEVTNDNLVSYGSINACFQGDMHRCATQCCDDTKLSMDNVQTCIEHCSQPAMQIQELLQNELQRMQVGLWL